MTGPQRGAVALAVLIVIVGGAVVVFGDNEQSSTTVTAAQPSDTSRPEGATATSTTAAPEQSTTTAPPAATYHVSVDGDDEAGDGSEARPWATIAHAESQAIDGSLILVGPGEYQGEVRLRRAFDDGIVIRSSEEYGARLRNDGQVLACYICAGITVEGFDIAHNEGDAERYVIQIQDAEGDGVGGQRFTLRNNVIHDSSNNDLLKVNNGAGDILIDGNLFYNQRGPDSHIDINSAHDVVVTRNVFFNDFGEELLGTASFIVIKDSNGEDDRNLGATRITVSGNVLLNWQGTDGAGFFSIGEDEVPYHQAHDVMVENNLLLGNSSDPIRAAFLAKGVYDVTFRNNTIAGDLPGETFGIRLSLQEGNPPNERVSIHNNVWSDPTGTMGTEIGSPPTEFADAPEAETLSLEMAGNLYWNGGNPIAFDSGGVANAVDDESGIVADPLLPAQNGVLPPTWDPARGIFADGSATIAQVFERMVRRYGVPAPGSPVVGAAIEELAPDVDILGNPRVSHDIGAVELSSLD